MFRAIFELLLTILVVTVLKSIVGIVMRGMSSAMSDTMKRPGAAPGRPRNSQEIPVTGELKKDPVCGTYIAAATSIKKTVAGQTIHFCSEDCRDKYVAPVAR